MSGLDALKETFFVECEDLLDALTDGLSSMADGSSDAETVHAVFRAVHSIKGAAGAFALNDLVAFAHKFETVLDLVRSDQLQPDAEVLHLLQRAGDILADLVDAARNESEPASDMVEAVTEALVELANANSEPEAEFVFQPIGLGLGMDAGGPPPAPSGYQIRFQTGPGFFENGHDPLRLFTALAELGPVTSRCDLSALPPLAELDPGLCYLAWDLTVDTGCPEPMLREIFSFAEGYCTLEITPLEGPAQEGGGGFAALPFAPLAAEPPAETAAAKAEDAPPATPAPPAAKDKAKPAAAASEGPRPTLRVDLERVDKLINSVGELIINQAVISQKVSEAGLPAASELLADLDDYKLLARELQEAVMAIRAQPVKPLFQRMSRIVREVSDATGKPIQLITLGEGTEVDKTVIEKLADPLTHMVRNAIDHGIEPPEARTAAGKPALGTVTLSAEHRSGSVIIDVCDDGGGLKRDKIKETAIRKGLIAPDADLSESEIDNLLFAPGFSTAATVTNLSGRGVGMDVVKTAITSLGGRIMIKSTPGQGSTFSIALPLTLAVLDGMVVTVADQTMVVPLASILETIRPGPSDIRQIGREGHILAIRGAYVPIIDLADCLGLQQGAFDPTAQVILLVRRADGQQMALAVKSIADQRQVVIKSLEGNYGNTPGIAAATILGDGKIALIVDPESLITKPVKMPSPAPAPLAGNAAARPQLERELQHG